MNLSTIVDQGLKVSPNTHIRMCSKYERDQIFLLGYKAKSDCKNIMSTQVKYESDQISLLCDSMVLSALSFCFLSILS